MGFFSRMTFPNSYRNRRGLSHFVRPTLALILVCLVVIPFPGLARAADCQFVLGFRTLHDLIPAIVGDCASNESHNPVNGDALQNTTRGLLVWRKADNHTAFTDGYRTWVNGPFVLQLRLNTAKFSWEPEAAPANVDPRLSAAYQLAGSSQFSNLMSNLATRNIPVGIGPLGPNVFGETNFDRTSGRITVTIDPAVEGGDPHDAAAVLIHEATHVYNFTHGLNITTSQGCIDEELAATENDVAFWESSFGPGGKPTPTNLFEQGENAEVRLAASNIRALLFQAFETYRSECGL